MEAREILKTFTEKLPKVQSGFGNMMKNITESSSLDAKTRELVMVALLTAQKAPSGAKVHAGRAIDAGASIEDILSAMAQSVPVAGIGALMDCLHIVVELEAADECRNN